MAKIPIAVVTGDWHLHKFKNFNANDQRLLMPLECVKRIDRDAQRLGVPILFLGDLLHTPESVETETNIWVRAVMESMESQVFYISGNHDQSRENTFLKPSPSHCYAFFWNDNFKSTEYQAANIKVKNLNLNLQLCGIPYSKRNSELEPWIKEFSRPKDDDLIRIVMIHADIPQAEHENGYMVEEVDNVHSNFLSRILKNDKIDLVVGGHIHKPQLLNRKVLLAGAPYQQRTSDMGLKMGYWVLYWSTKHERVIPEFVDCEMPEFKMIDSLDNLPDDYHFYMLPHLTNIFMESEAEDEGTKLDLNNKKAIIRRYLKVWEGGYTKEREKFLTELISYEY